MNRRTLLSAATFIIPAAIVGCSVTSTTLTQVQQDAQLIGTGLTALVASLSSVPSIPASVIAQAQAAVTTVQAAVTQIVAAVSPSASVVTNLSAAVSTLAALLTPWFPIAPMINGILQAAIALVPAIMIAAGLPAPTAATATSTSPDEARAMLRMVAVGR